MRPLPIQYLVSIRKNVKTMKLKLLVVICSLLLCLTTTAISQTRTAALSESEKLNKLLENAFEDYLRTHPIVATAIGDHRYDKIGRAHV